MTSDFFIYVCFAVSRADADINRAYKNIESRAELKLIDTLPDELRAAFAPCVQPDKNSAERLIVKRAAEILPLSYVIGSHSGPGTVALFFTGDTRVETLIKCVEELAVGNVEFKNAYEVTKSEIDASPEK